MRGLLLKNKKLALGILIFSYAAQISTAYGGEASNKRRKPGSQSVTRSQDLSDTDSQRGVGLDFHLGTSLATMSGEGDSIASSKLGLTAGIGLNLPLSSQSVFLHPELNYVQKGFAINLNPSQYGVDALNGSLNLNYIELPILLKLEPAAQSSFRPNFVVGPAFSYLVSKSTSASARVGSQSASATSNGQDLATKSFDYGIQAGVGADIAVNRTQAVLIDLRYNLGLGNVSNESGSAVYNRAATLSLGYRI